MLEPMIDVAVLVGVTGCFLLGKQSCEAVSTFTAKGQKVSAY